MHKPIAVLVVVVVWTACADGFSTDEPSVSPGEPTEVSSSLMSGSSSGGLSKESSSGSSWQHGGSSSATGAGTASSQQPTASSAQEPIHSSFCLAFSGPHEGIHVELRDPHDGVICSAHVTATKGSRTEPLRREGCAWVGGFTPDPQNGAGTYRIEARACGYETVVDDNFVVTSPYPGCWNKVDVTYRTYVMQYASGSGEQCDSSTTSGNSNSNTSNSSSNGSPSSSGGCASYGLDVVLRDQNGSGICEAAVTVSGSIGGTRSLRKEACHFLGVENPGAYQVWVSASGYEPVTESNIEVHQYSCPYGMLVPTVKMYTLQSRDGGQ